MIGQFESEERGKKGLKIHGRGKHMKKGGRKGRRKHGRK